MKFSCGLSCKSSSLMAAEEEDSFAHLALLSDRNIPLDHDLIATVVTGLLNLKDVTKPFEMPVFRIRELLTVVQRLRTSLLNEIRLTESLLALYALCLYFSVSTTIDAGVAVELLSLLQLLCVESLVVESASRPQSLEMPPPGEVFAKDESIDTAFKLEIFAESLDTARAVVRDALRLSRSLQKLRQAKTDQRKRAMPKQAECVQPYCVYFLTNLALCHVTSLLSQTQNLVLCPGNIEALFVSMLTTTSAEQASSRASTASRASSAGEKERQRNKPLYAFASCIIAAQRLSTFVGHHVLTESALEMAMLLRSKFSNHLTHPDLRFVHYRVSLFRSVLEQIPSNAELLTQRILFSPGSHFLSEFRPSLVIAPQQTEKEEEDSASVDLSSVQTPSVASRSVMAGSVMTSSVARQEQSSLGGYFFSNSNAKREQHFWELKAPFRPLFLTFHGLLRENTFSAGFNKDYRPDLTEFPKGNLVSCAGVKQMPRKSAIKYLEGYYFYWCSKDYLPHTLNPLNEMYWICNMIVEHLKKRADLGRGFCPSLLKEKQFLQRKLKAIKQESVTGSRIPKLPPVAARCSSSAQAKRSSSKAASCTDLAKLLSTAKLEAQLESRLDRIDATLSGGNNTLSASASADEESDEGREGEDDIAAMWKDVRPFSRGADAHTQSEAVKSIVWHCEPKNKASVKTTIFAGIVDEQAADDPMQDLPSKASAVEYARRLQEERERKKQEEENLQRRLEDEQETIISKNRATKTATLRGMRDKMKEDLQTKALSKKSWENEQRKRQIEEKVKAQRLEKEKELAEQRELHRIRQIKEMKKFEEERAAEEHAFNIEKQKNIISRIASQKEADEIRRMLQEEERMRYLEERRRAIEEKLYAQKKQVLHRELSKRAKSKEAVDKIQARVRLGNFMWHNGQLGFYDGVRKSPVKYIQYEDEHGPYYYDPINGTCQRRMPSDAPIEHYTDGERREYDAIHGAGAYDAYKADIAFKDSVNKLGGYYDEDGNWVVARGYYDENYEWVDYDGYYNEQGRYIKYPKIQGNLDFMV